MFILIQANASYTPEDRRSAIVAISGRRRLKAVKIGDYEDMYVCRSLPRPKVRTRTYGMAEFGLRVD